MAATRESYTPPRESPSATGVTPPRPRPSPTRAPFRAAGEQRHDFRESESRGHAYVEKRGTAMFDSAYFHKVRVYGTVFEWEFTITERADSISACRFLK